MPERLVNIALAEWWWALVLPFTLLVLLGVWLVILTRQRREVKVELGGLGVHLRLQLGKADIHARPLEGSI